jgi:hypothetical protein
LSWSEEDGTEKVVGGQLNQVVSPFFFHSCLVNAQKLNLIFNVLVGTVEHNAPIIQPHCDAFGSYYGALV